MGEKAKEVVLFGTWYSSYTNRVALALKLKGIPYNYVEENLANKSELLLKYNPTHKKVPVLLHRDSPISESLIILEYIDEVWNHHTPILLPKDPYQKAKIRFWANYFDEKIAPGTYPILRSKGEEREKAIEKMYEMLKVFEEGVELDCQEHISFFNGGTLGLLDIVVGATMCIYEAFHEAIDTKVLVPEKTPKFLMWVNALKEHPLVKDILPPHDKLVAVMKIMIDMPPHN